MNNQDQIIQLEEKLRQAMLASDVAKLDELLASDLVFITHTGGVISKADDLATHGSGLLKISNIDFSERHIRHEGAIAVVSVLAALKGSYDQQSFAGNFRYMRVWRLKDSQWQIFMGQATQVA